MKANELRIGNWVFSEETESNFVIDEHSFSAITIEHIDAIKPIPLTDEWLKRFGFEVEGLGYEIYDRFLTLIPEEDEGFDVLIMTADFEKPMYITYIDYVHQLQNLYHALTGEELKEKEDELES